MSKIACLYFEGNDSKIALFQKENNVLKLLKAESIDTSLVFADHNTAGATKSNGGSKSKEVLNYDFFDEGSSFNRSYLQKLGDFFLGEEISKIKFIPILTEPAVYFQKINDVKELANINVNKKGKIDTAIAFVPLHDNLKLAVYPSGKTNYLQLIDLFAKMNNRRFLKIPSVKNAEISLASYILRKRKFDKSETSLILYVGKDYSKVIFLRGQKLHHIGSTLSVGKNSFNAHSVIVSKILLEMERGGISNIDNIIITGEDESAELLTAVSEAYAGAEVFIQTLDNIEAVDIDKFSTEASFIIPAAVAEEYFAELDKKLSGINLLPEYVKNEQKILNIGLYGYLLIALIILSAAFFINNIYSNIDQLKSKTEEIKKYQLIQAQNREMVNRISSYENKIQNVDQTKVTLDQLSNGTGILTGQLKKLSSFTGARRTLWISQLKMDELAKLRIAGYTFSRRAVKELADSYNGSTLENIMYEPLRELRAFKFSIDGGALMEGVVNEKKR